MVYTDLETLAGLKKVNFQELQSNAQTNSKEYSQKNDKEIF